MNWKVGQEIKYINPFAVTPDKREYYGKIVHVWIDVERADAYEVDIKWSHGFEVVRYDQTSPILARVKLLSNLSENNPNRRFIEENIHEKT